MRFLSVCSGIEAASVAFEPLGWKALAFSEIEAFPRAVLHHHYPDVPLHGDFTKLKDEPWIVDADMLCGGTPCQAFSVAGLRQSLADDRGNLTLQFVLLANAIDHLRSDAGKEPAWILWENVPGVLSTRDNAFGAFLGGLCGSDTAIPEPANGWADAGVVDGPARCCAWRVMDAQHFGLAQRRKRVFVLAKGGAGRWAAPDALLPIIPSSRWHPAPSRSKGEGVAPTISARTKGGGGLGTDAECDGALIAFDPTQVTSPANGSNPQPGDPCHPLAAGMHPPMLVRMREGKEGGGKGPLVSNDQSLTLATANDQVLAYSGKNDTLQTKGVSHASTYEADASSILSTLLDQVGAEAFTQWGLRILGAFQSPEVLRSWLHGESIRRSSESFRHWMEHSARAFSEDAAGRTMLKVWERGPDGRTSQGRGLAKQLGGEPGEALSVLPQQDPLSEADLQVVRQAREGARILREALSTLQEVGRPDDSKRQPTPSSYQVRRLTPREAARLQGFPDDYLDITFRGKPAADGHKYKALGNSWAVPVVRYIGEQIKRVTP